MKKTASNAHIWTKCEGYIKQVNDFIKVYGRVDFSSSMDEGLLAHKLAETLLNERLDGISYPALPREINGHVLPVDMRLKISDYVEYCLADRDLEKEIIWVEDSFNCGFLDIDNYARVDFAVYNRETKCLTVIDLKYGHRDIPAENNPQLLISARAMMDEIDEEVVSINLAIYQPNGPSAYIPSKEWFQSHEDVVAKTNHIKMIYDRDGNGLAPGKHCRYCDARGACTAVRAALFEAWEVMTYYNYLPQNLTADALETMLAESEAIKDLQRSYQTGLEALCISRMQAGENFRSWEYSSSLGNKKWDYPNDDIIEIGRSFDIDMTKNDLISPAQAIAAGIPQEVVNSLVRRDSTGLKLRKKSLKTLKQAFNN